MDDTCENFGIHPSGETMLELFLAAWPQQIDIIDPIKGSMPPIMMITDKEHDPLDPGSMSVAHNLLFLDDMFGDWRLRMAIADGTWEDVELAARQVCQEFGQPDLPAPRFS